MRNSKRKGPGAFFLRPSTLAMAMAAASLAAPALAQEAEDAAAEEEIVVTGFRASLRGALDVKRTSSGIVDAILAEDIADFPDSNLAESIQRIPGVTLTRSDGGEGRQITVRGLNSAFTRVRLNGIEGTSATGASDILGSTNRGRGFDFSVFASELFNSVAVRKTSSADVEEGSLGATVDLTTGRPFDFDGFTFAMSGQAVRNDLEEGYHPRITALISDTWANDRFGALFSLAWSERTVMEEGYEAVDILPASADGGFCTPVGFAPQSPANDAIDGTDAANCATGIPRSGNLAAYNDVFSRTDNFGGTVANPAPGSGAFHPRLPRYRRSVTDYERIGATGSLQWRPTEATDVNLDMLWGEFSNVRHDNYIQLLSTGRNLGAGGKPHMSILDAEFDDDGSWVYGRFGGADIRSEGLREIYTTYYNQAGLSVSHELGDNLRVAGLYGTSHSHLKAPFRTTVQIDAPNTSSFSFDFRENNNIPTLDFGVDIADPNSFLWTGVLTGTNQGNSALPDGTLRGAWNGRWLSTETHLETSEIEVEWDVADWLKLRAGASLRANTWENYETGPRAGQAFDLGAPISQVTRLISGFGNGIDADVPDAWVAIDLDELLSVVNLHCNCTTVPGGADMPAPTPRIVDENITAYYAMGAFNFDLAGITWRGDLGVRYIETDLDATGRSVFGSSFVDTTVNNTYDDTLPSFNLTAELTDEFFLRFSAARVLSRPDYTALIPAATVNRTVQTVGIGNPFLDPIRANTYDLQAEWYFAEDTLLSVGIFHKDVETFIQPFRELVLWNTLGLPDVLLTQDPPDCSLTGGASGGLPACPTQRDTLVSVSRSVNTNGGPLTGFEVNLQLPFSSFLDGFWGNFGVLANYTHIESEIEYITRTDNPLTAADEELTVTGEFAGLSPTAYNLTLFYEDERFSARISSSYKDEAMNNALGNVQGHDFIFTDPATYYDMFGSYNFNDRLRLTFEGLNLTDQEVRFGQDSERNDTRLWVHSGRTFTVGFNYRY